MRGRVVLPPEGCKRPIERRDLFGAMDEQRPARVIHLVARRQIHISEPLDNVEEAPGMNIDASEAEKASEDQQVIEKA
jgi:hypothetical protein